MAERSAVGMIEGSAVGSAEGPADGLIDRGAFGHNFRQSFSARSFDDAMVSGVPCSTSLTKSAASEHEPRFSIAITNMNLPSDHERIPWLAWPSMLSLDAVMVAVVWQQMLMRGFCHRGSTWPEAGSLGATVWLIYVADRLLDAARLDVNAAHTLRHGFYLRHRRIFLALWIAVLAISAFVVVHYLPHDLLRGGLLLAAAVLIYGASVHFSPMRSPATSTATRHHGAGWSIPKEIRVGALFAIGVTLSPWTELITGGGNGPNILAPLAATTCVLAVLFAGNCILVAKFESELDRAQSFPSIATGASRLEHGGRFPFVQTAIALMMVLPMILVVLPMPLPVLLTILISAAGLCGAAMCSAPSRRRSLPCDGQASFDARGAWVDAAVWAPPLAVMLLGVL